jgi:hypothetical protein
MKTIDLGIYFVTYNFIIGVLLMIGSEKFGVYAGYLIKPYREKASRIAQTGAFTFGATVAFLMTGIYIAGYVFKL